MENDQYFPHDVTAQNNFKIMRLKSDKGYEGYGLYWALLENLRLQKNYSMPISFLPQLAIQLLTSVELLRDVVQKYGLFVVDNEGFFFSAGLVKRMKPLEEKRKARDARREQTVTAVPLPRPSRGRQRRRNTPSTSAAQQESTEPLPMEELFPTAPFEPDLTPDLALDATQNGTEKETEMHHSEVVQNGANELFESAQNNAQNSVQNNMQSSAKTTQNAHLQNADNERVAMHSLVEESKVEKDKGKYGCCGTTTARMDACTTTTSIDVRRRVRSERSPVLPKSLWEVYVSEAMGERSWLELQAMHSGMGMRFMECVPIIEETFKRHVRTYGTESKIHSLCDAKSYFSNFIKRGSPTRRIVEEALKTCTTTVDVYRYETLVNGRRTYCGVDIPAEAPPRPNGTAVWDGGLRIWSK